MVKITLINNNITMSKETYKVNGIDYDVQCEHCMSYNVLFIESWNDKDNNDIYYELYECEDCWEETTINY